MLWERARAGRPGGHTHTPAHAEPDSEVSKQKNTHTQGHTTRKVPLWINNTDPHTHKNCPASLSIMRCHKQPFSSVVLSGTIKICVTQAGCCSPGGATGKHTFRRTQKHISAFLSHTEDHDRAAQAVSGLCPTN